MIDSIKNNKNFVGLVLCVFLSSCISLQGERKIKVKDYDAFAKSKRYGASYQVFENAS